MDAETAGCDPALACAAATFVIGVAGTQQSAAATVAATMRRLRFAKMMEALKKDAGL